MFFATLNQKDIKNKMINYLNMQKHDFEFRPEAINLYVKYGK